MSNGFVKIYGSKLVTSSLWDECPEARLVWFSMLAVADMHGVVDTPSEKALARYLNLPQDYLERGLAVLMAPDSDSRTKSFEGRRVIRDGSVFRCVNYEKYRDFRTPKQEADRRRIASQRAQAIQAKAKRGDLAAHRAAQKAKRIELGTSGVAGELTRIELGRGDT